MWPAMIAEPAWLAGAAGVPGAGAALGAEALTRAAIQAHPHAIGTVAGTVKGVARNRFAVVGDSPAPLHPPPSRRGQT
jgi:hypothetical protein